MYKHDINRLENHIADNHVWQMTFRILTMAAFTIYGELPEADEWTDYCYTCGSPVSRSEQGRSLAQRRFIFPCQSPHL